MALVAGEGLARSGCFGGALAEESAAPDEGASAGGFDGNGASEAGGKLGGVVVDAAGAGDAAGGAAEGSGELWGEG